MIIVLDTNVWISALQFGGLSGIPRQALERASTDDVIASCEEIEAEIYRVLTEKFSWQPRRVNDAFGRLLGRAVRVELRGDVKACRDPNDDMFLECAVRANAELLIAGDKDLLVMASYKSTRIVTPAEYVRMPL